MNRCTTTGLAVISLLWLGACGGGGSGSAPTASAASAPASAASSASAPASAPSTVASAPATGASAVAAGAAGLWTGSTGDTRNYAQLVLGNGDYYLFYSPIGDTDSVGGAMFGTGTVSGQTYAAPNGHVFDIQTSGVHTTALTATFVAKMTLQGNYTSAAGGTIVNFVGNYDATSTDVPTLANLAGTYAGSNGSNAGVQAGTTTVTVGLDGAVVIVNGSTCSASGKATPRTDGNAYDLALKFSAGCALANQSTTGIAYSNLAAHRLYALTPTADRTDFFLFVGAAQ